MLRMACCLTYILVLIGMPFAAALFRVDVRQDCLNLGYRLSVLQQQRDELRAQVRQAELERARGRAPAVLMQMAQKLQLGPPRVHNLGGALSSPKAKGPKRRAQSD